MEILVLVLSVHHINAHFLFRLPIAYHLKYNLLNTAVLSCHDDLS